MKNKFKYVTGLIVIGSLTWVQSLAQTTVTLKSLLTEMTDFESVARWPQIPYTIGQASSYDRSSVSPGKPGWFANDDRSHYIRTETTNGHKEEVMLDTDGPGAVVRFWLTTFRRNGNLRIYFDGKTNADILIPAYDLMKSGMNLGKALLQPHSSYEPKEKGGSTLYLPLPYAKHCKITWEDKDPDNQPRYYQVNYRTYQPGTKVTTFTQTQLDELQTLVASTNNKLLNPPDDKTGKPVKLSGNINPQKELTLKLPVRSAAVKYISIDIKTANTADHQQALRSVVLKASFDGLQTIWCPVGDFSGSGVGGKALQSWYRTVDNNGRIISRWIMPYQKSAAVSLMNLGNVNVQVSLTVVSGKWKWDNNSMYFHADWKNENKVAIKQTEKDKPTDWQFNKIEGKGIFIGDSFAVYNHMHKWYGEGDQKIWTDGHNFPDEYGTGTEDYYNTSWAPVALYQTPFANAPRADNADSFGYNTFTRTRNLDAVPFTQSFLYSLETLGWENGTADFAATTYWYGFKNAKSNVAADQSLPGALPTEK